MRAILALTLGLGALSAPSVVHAEDAQGDFRITATVPRSCWVEERTPPAITPGAVTGRVEEGCNSAEGYRVDASYRPLAPGERAVVEYGGRVVDLPAQGEATLHQARGAEISMRSYSLDTRQLNAPLVLAFTISPN